MGGKNSVPVDDTYSLQSSQQRTEKHGNICRSPATSTPKSPKSPKSRSTTFDDSTHWIHKDVDVEEIYELHDIIAYGHLGPIQICSKKRRRHSNHHGELVKVGRIKESDLTDGSSDSPSDPTTRKTSRHRLYACKTISLSRIRQDSLDALIKEVTTMRRVSLIQHMNILTIYKVCYTRRYLWIITELCTGGDLFSRMDSLTEVDIVDVLEQLVEAVCFLHKNGVCHCSIQLENVLYEHDGSNAGIKLIDYGQARKFGRGVHCWKVCGAEYWVAPEVHFSSTFLPSSDIWSIGVVAFILLSGGTYPFGSDCELDADRLEKAEYTFGNEWQERKISNDAKQFVRKCLQINPDNRLTAREALDYVRGWMANVEANDLLESDDQPIPLVQDEPGGSLRGRQHFDLYGQLKKRVLTAMADTMNKSSLDKLKDVLVGFDADGRGTLTLEQVRQAVKEFHQEKGESSPLTNEDIKEMFKGSQRDRSATIHYSAFLEAVLELQGMMTQERLGEAFDQTDREGKGWILKKDMKQILRPYCDEFYVERTIKEAGCGFNWPVLAEVVDYDKFLQFMFKDPSKGMGHISRLVK